MTTPERTEPPDAPERSRYPAVEGTRVQVLDGPSTGGGGQVAEDDLAAWAPAPSAPQGSPVPALTGYSGLVEVARGGDSIVYRARQDAVGRDVAIKVIDVRDPATLARFRRELEITVELGRQHPHIVNVLDTRTTDDGRACLVMDFHDLGSLHDRLRAHGALPTAEVVAVGDAVADALAFAHEHGVLHRDVKPQNVLVLPTSYVLTDFGIARMADAGHTASLDRFSYRHASPQVLDGLEPVPADDVWSLGSTLFTLLDGRPPFASDDPDDDTALAYLRRVRTGERRQVRTSAPAALLALVERCLSPAREDRPDARTVRALLGSVPTEVSGWAPGHTADGDDRAAAPRAAEPDGRRLAPAPDAPAAHDRDAAPRHPGAAPAPDQPGPSPAARRPEPAPPRPVAPTAPSALAVADAWPTGRGPTAPDAEATGLAPSAPPAAPDGVSPVTDPDAEPEEARRRWPALVGFVGGAVLLGSLIGTGAVLLAQRDGEAPTQAEPDPTAVPVDEVDPDVEIPQDPLDVALSDPTVAPVDLVLIDRGTSVVASWTDPTGGEVASALVDVTDEDAPRALEHVAAGVTERTVEGIDPGAPVVCLMVVAIHVDDPERYGFSEVACVEGRSPSG